MTAYPPLPGTRFTGEPRLADGVWHYHVTADPPPCLSAADSAARHVANGWRCRTCGARAHLPWIDPAHPYYHKDAIAFARRRGLVATFAAVAKALACEESFVRRLCRPVMLHLVHTYRPQAPRLLAIDEDHLGRTRKSRSKRLVLVDAETPRGQGLIEIGRSDTDAELRRLLLSLENPERIIAVALDGLER